MPMVLAECPGIVVPFTTQGNLQVRVSHLLSAFERPRRTDQFSGVESRIVEDVKRFAVRRVERGELVLPMQL